MTDALFLFDPQVDDVPVNSDELHAGWKLTLPAHIKRHAVQAMRLKAGDNLQLSDGNGLRIQAVMADPEAGLAEVVEVGREPEPLTRLALIQALAKTGHDEQAIDMATQIGVDQVVPWQADRSIAKWKVGRTDKKWNSVLDAATEQSRRAFKPQLEACAWRCGDCAASGCYRYVVRRGGEGCAVGGTHAPGRPAADCQCGGRA